MKKFPWHLRLTRSAQTRVFDKSCTGSYIYMAGWIIISKSWGSNVAYKISVDHIGM